MAAQNEEGPKFDRKELFEIAKFLNIGGVLGVVVIALVTGFIWGSGCGPIMNSGSWGESKWYGAPVLQDHPEAVEAAH